MVYRSGNPVPSAIAIQYFKYYSLNSKPFSKFLVFRTKLLNGVLLFDLGKEFREAVYRTLAKDRRDVL